MFVIVRPMGYCIIQSPRQLWCLFFNKGIKFVYLDVFDNFVTLIIKISVSSRKMIFAYIYRKYWK